MAHKRVYFFDSPGIFCLSILNTLLKLARWIFQLMPRFRKWKENYIHKGPVKLIKRVKIAHSFLQSVSDQFQVNILSLPM